MLLAGAWLALPARSQAAPTDAASLLRALRAAGARVGPREALEQPFIAARGFLVPVEGEGVQVFEYPDAAAAAAEAARVSPDGTQVGLSRPLWAAPPHFFRNGRVLVLYVGEDARVLRRLQAVLGPQFAGR